MSQQQRPSLPATCPPWCSLSHGIHGGEEGAVHISHQLCVRDTLMRLCSSNNPATGEQDGPYLLMGLAEYSMDEVDTLIDSLQTLRGWSRDATIPRQPHKPVVQQT